MTISNKSFCPHCGLPMFACPECGRICDVESLFCSTCGSDLSGYMQSAKESDSQFAPVTEAEAKSLLESSISFGTVASREDVAWLKKQASAKNLKVRDLLDDLAREVLARQELPTQKKAVEPVRFGFYMDRELISELRKKAGRSNLSSVLRGMIRHARLQHDTL